MHQIKLPNQPGWPEPLVVPASEAAGYFDWLAAVQEHTFVWASYGDKRNIPGGNFPKLIAFGSVGTEADTSCLNALGQIEDTTNYTFGIIGYEQGQHWSKAELKHTSPKLLSDFPTSAYFHPEGMIIWETDQVCFYGLAIGLEPPKPVSLSANGVIEPLAPLLSAEGYKNRFDQVKSYIKSGDTYELNLCLPYKGQANLINPSAVFKAITDTAPAPFTVWFKAGDHQVFSASPERFLQKIADRVISQPIKGTAPRQQDTAADQLVKFDLTNSEKERGENLMIVDMVRHDLASVATPGSVVVDELIKCYSFSHVHQLISTISAEVPAGVGITQVIEKTFPMGSMTGAPKERTTEIIAELEPYQRGWFSGSLFYRTPANDWDMNVVIRSLFYDAETRQIVTWAGSAITWDAEPEAEYNECQTKTRHWQQVLAQFQQS